MEPQNLLILLSEYFDAMQQIIGAHESRGTLLEFIGDALLVVWNAPQLAKNATLFFFVF